jgi:hypothetical protein
VGNDLVGAPTSDPGGLCSAPAALEAPCLHDRDCRSRESCVCGRCTVQYCTANSDCGPDQVCQFGSVDGNRCVPPCTTDDDCAAGERCQQPRCVSGCETDADCQTGEFCATIGVRRRCAARACGDDGDCASGDVCRIQRRPRAALEPSPLARARAGEPAVVLWLELSDDRVQTERAIYRAQSTDGLSFRLAPAAPVVTDPLGAHAPSAVRLPDGGVIVYYHTDDRGELRAARSAEGIAFEPAATALTASAAGVRSLAAPGAVALPDGRVAVYYEVDGGASIDVAVGPPGGALTPLGPALTPASVDIPPNANADAPFWTELASVGSPHASLVVDASGAPQIRLWFSAFGRESGDSRQLGQVVAIPPNASVGVATAPLAAPAEPITWPFNPVFDRISVFVDHRSELGPAGVQLTGPDGAPRESFLLFYVSADAEAAQLERLGVAHNGD